MLRIIDNILNRITMYRLVLYFLCFLILTALALGALGILPYSPLMLLFSASALLLVCVIANSIFSKVFQAPTNVESAYITALILTLIITPPTSLNDFQYLIFIFWAGVLAMASKYILAIGKKHIFNPAAFAVMLTAFTINQPASWWVGTISMAPFVLVGGLLIVRKLKRTDMVIAFTLVALVSTFFLHPNTLATIPTIVWHGLTASPFLFFAIIMLTEPLTTPPNRTLRIIYGMLVGVMFDPVMHIGAIFSTPEISLILGNIFSYFVSPKKKLTLMLKEKIQVARDTYEFIFTKDIKEFKFTPGQYLEWTLSHQKPDSRGNRRYFTLASAPHEENIKIGVKFYPDPSTFKQTLFDMKKGDKIMAGQLSGDFTLPKNKGRKLCFLAGGIGITPFQSIIGEMLNQKEKRDIVLFYANKTFSDVAYMNTFDKAEKELGIKTVYTFSDEKVIPDGRNAEIGFVTADMLKSEMPDYKDRMYFISGPHAMVTSFEDTLSKMGISRSNIKIDFFPGFV